MKIKLLLLFFLLSCTNKEEKKTTTAKTKTSIHQPETRQPVARRPVAHYNNRNNDDNDDNDCGYEDDTYSADVDYYNPSTGYSQTYTLDVVVEDCQVVEIDFPKGGYLDNDHIDPTDIDDNGDASVEDDRGSTFDIHLSESDKSSNDDDDDDNDSNDY